MQHRDTERLGRTALAEGEWAGLLFARPARTLGEGGNQL